MTKKDDAKGKVDFSPPELVDYRQRIEAAKSGHIPVGGTEMPSMPRLDQPVPKNRYEGVQGGAKAMSQEQHTQALMGGKAIPGVGSAYPANQPRGFTPPDQGQGVPPQMEVSSKDGNPVNPPRAEGGLRAETTAALQAVAQANTDEKAPLTKEDEDYISKLGEETKDIISNKERREFIEGRIEDELNFEDLLFQQELRQKVPIRKNFFPTYRTPSADEDLFVKRKMSKEDGSPQYIMDMYAALSLVCGLFAINGKPLPDHCDDKKKPKEELFEEKFRMVMKYPLVIVADLSANYVWFLDRVNQLMSLDAIKNF